MRRTAQLLRSFRGRLLLFFPVLACFSLGLAKSPFLLPFEHTGDALVMDDNCGCILRITREKVISIELTKAQILAVSGDTEIEFDNGSLVVDARGGFYFSDSMSNMIFRQVPGEALASFYTSDEILQALAEAGSPAAEVKLIGLAFGEDGFLYVVDDFSAIYKINTETRDLEILVGPADFRAVLDPTDEIDTERGLVATAQGLLYVASDGTPDAVFSVASNGAVSLLYSGPPLFDPDRYATRAPNGDLILVDVAENAIPDTIRRITPQGEISDFLTRAQIEQVSGAPWTNDGGIAFDGEDNFYVADEGVGQILRFDPDLNGSVWITADQILEVTGPGPKSTPDLEATIAFEPEYKLYFAQFGDGLDLLSSEIVLISLDQERPTTANILLKDGDGLPLQVDLNGEEVAGVLEDVVVPAQGKVVLRTDGMGELSVGSVTVCSDKPVAGVIVFSGVAGLAGVQSSQPQEDGFIAPIESRNPPEIQTGIAVMNLENVLVTLDLTLLDAEGEIVATARVELPAMGQLAVFVDEVERLNWDRPVDFSALQATVRVDSDGRVAATVVQMRPGRFATQPVAPKTAFSRQTIH